MGRALIQGMIHNRVVREDQVTVSEPDTASRDWWSTNLPKCALASGNSAAIRTADWVIVAVKPDVVSAVAKEISSDSSTDSANVVGRKILISVAAGIRLADLEAMFGSDRVVRVMPNTPALVGAGACAYCCGAGISNDEKLQVAAALEAVGIAVEVADKAMDAVTGLSGSGPALVCVVIEALADGGVLAGLPRALAQRLAAQTVLGTAKLVLETGLHPAELKDQVASPGGTTIAALQVLEQSGVRGALMTAVKRAADRSRELA